MSETSIGRKKREERARKQYILDKAEELFARSGLQGTSVADIARAAEFGVGTLYRYFDDKETLIRELVKTRLDEHFNAVEEALEGPGTARERIEAQIRAFFRSAHRLQRFFRLYHTSFHPGSGADGSGGDHECAMSERRRALGERVERLFARGIADGEFVDRDPRWLTAAVHGIVIGFFFSNELRGDDDWSPEDLADEAIAIFMGPVSRSAVPQSEKKGSTDDHAR